MVYIVLLLIGPVLGAFINCAIYSWAWIPRAVSPWSPPNQDAPPRQWTDRIPIFGWLGLRREGQSHVGRQKEIYKRFEPAGQAAFEVPPPPKVYAVFYWLRPMLIEISFGPMLAGLYWWEVEKLGLLTAGAPALMQPVMLAAVSKWMTIMFCGHAMLLMLLMIATFIDFDEQTIPDAVTIPGTLLALFLAVVGCWLMPDVVAPFCMPWTRVEDYVVRDIVAIQFYSPRGLHSKWVSLDGLILGVGIFAVWCFALANRRWIGRHGVVRGLQYFAAGLVKHELQLFGRFRMKVWLFLTALCLVGSVGITLVFCSMPDHWPSLLSALVGMGIGGGQIWAVRIVARLGLGKEAMGFGDVTLMAMVGGFLGWQAALFAFFLAPFAALAIVVVSWLLTGNRMLPFGPYLALGSVLTAVLWDPIWNGWGADVFTMGPLIGFILGFALCAMCGMLMCFRMLERAITGKD